MGKTFKFRLGQKVETKSGLQGKVIGSAKYLWGNEYRVKIAGRSKTLYRKEAELKKPVSKRK